MADSGDVIGEVVVFRQGGHCRELLDIVLESRLGQSEALTLFEVALEALTTALFAGWDAVASDASKGEALLDVALGALPTGKIENLGALVEFAFLPESVVGTGTEDDEVADLKACVLGVGEDGELHLLFAGEAFEELHQLLAGGFTAVGTGARNDGKGGDLVRPFVAEHASTPGVDWPGADEGDDDLAVAGEEFFHHDVKREPGAGVGVIGALDAANLVASDELANDSVGDLAGKAKVGVDGVRVDVLDARNSPNSTLESVVAELEVYALKPLLQMGVAGILPKLGPVERDIHLGARKLASRFKFPEALETLGDHRWGQLHAVGFERRIVEFAQRRGAG